MKMFRGGGRTSSSQYLVAFGDTEGVVGRNGLWSVTLVVRAVVVGPSVLQRNPDKLQGLKLKKHCYHVLSFNGDVGHKKATSSHFDAIHHLNKRYRASGVLLCFWNAAHDKAQLHSSQIENSELTFHYVDMIRFVKAMVTYPKYRLGYLRYDVYGSETEKELLTKQDHTSLHDTDCMLHVLFCAVTEPAPIAPAMEAASESARLKRIVTHDCFLLGLLDDSGTVKPKAVAVDPKYEYFQIEEVDYKVRRGFEGSTSAWYRGYGLYERRGAQYRRITSRERKEKILGKKLALDASNHYINTKVKQVND